MAKLKINIKGNSLIYPSGTGSNIIWKVLLPFEEIYPNYCHDVKLTFPSLFNSDKDEVENLAQNGARLRIGNNSGVSTADKTSSFTDYVFDFSNNNVHGANGLARKHQSGNMASPFVELDLQNATVDIGVKAPNKFILFESVDAQNYQAILKQRYLFKSIVATMDTTNVEMHLGDQNGNWQPLPLRIESTNENEITIDNDCRKISNTDNDFRMIYDKLVTPNNGKEFTLQWIPDFYFNKINVGNRILKSDVSEYQENGRTSLTKSKIDSVLNGVSDNSEKLFISLQEMNREIGNDSFEDIEKLINKVYYIAQEDVVKKISREIELLTTDDITYPCFVYGTDGLT